jgi:hypothetical protein
MSTKQVIAFSTQLTANLEKNDLELDEKHMKIILDAFKKTLNNESTVVEEMHDDDANHFTITAYLFGSTPNEERLSMRYYANIHNIEREAFLEKYDMYLYLETFAEAFGNIIDGEIDESFMDGDAASPLPDAQVSIVFDAKKHTVKFNSKVKFIEWEIENDDE